MASSSAARMVTLRSSDGKEFVVAEAVAAESQIVKFVMDDCDDDDVIPIVNVTGTILAKVIEYCTRHADAPADDHISGDKLSEWDAEFIKVDQGTLFGLLNAAQYMDIQSLYDLTCKTVADMMKGKAPQEIRRIFNIKNDYTPEEEEEVRRENAWAFD